MPKFSIIIPVYNTSKYLDRCLDSIFNQYYKNYEVIIINDGSTDDSDIIIKNKIKTKKNVLYISKDNGGLSSARNAGVNVSSGEYLLFLDSDDYYCDGFLDKLCNEVGNADVLRYQVQDVFPDGKVVLYNDKVFSDLDGVSSFNYLCRSHYVEIACAYCYKRSFWLEHNFKFESGGELDNYFDW